MGGARRGGGGKAILSHITHTECGNVAENGQTTHSTQVVLLCRAIIRGHLRKKTIYYWTDKRKPPRYNESFIIR